MNILLSNIIDIENPSKDLISYVKKQLTFKNPEMEKKKRMGFYCYGMDKEIKLYNLYDGHLYVPYGFFEKLFNYYPNSNEYTDYTISKKVNITSHITLRDYQMPVIRAVKEHCNGLVVAPCGLGKTSMGLACFGALKEKTLWLCHSHELLEQAKSRCEETITCKTSVISEGKCDVSGDIVFATIQTVVKYIENDTLKQDDFGMVIGDEIHRVSANPSSFQMYRKSIEFFASKYRIGLSATIHRADGMQDCIKAILGEIIYEIEQRDSTYCCMYNGKMLMTFPTSKFQVPAHIKVIETNYNVLDKNVFSANGGTIQYATLISDLAMNRERNWQIIRELRKIEGSTIILSDRVEQLKYLCKHVENGVQIDGTTPKKERQKAIEDTRKGKCKYLFASYNLCREGLDIPILSNLVMASPVKDFAIVVQSVGRIQRPYEGKKIAYVYDFVDEVSMLYRFYSKRRATYRKNNWEIDNIYLGGK